MTVLLVLLVLYILYTLETYRSTVRNIGKTAFIFWILPVSPPWTSRKLGIWKPNSRKPVPRIPLGTRACSGSLSLGNTVSCFKILPGPWFFIDNVRNAVRNAIPTTPDDSVVRWMEAYKLGLEVNFMSKHFGLTVNKVPPTWTCFQKREVVVIMYIIYMTVSNI